MKKISILWISVFVIAGFACEPKPSESAANDGKDSLKKDSVIAPATDASAASQLTGNAKIVAKKWYATEIQTPNIKLTSELTDIRFNFQADGNFEYYEDGKKESGKWKANDESKMLLLEYDSPAKRKADFAIEKINEDTLIMSGKDNNMYRTYKLAPKK